MLEAHRYEPTVFVDSPELGTKSEILDPQKFEHIDINALSVRYEIIKQNDSHLIRRKCVEVSADLLCVHSYAAV